MEVIECGHHLVPGFGDAVEPVLLPGVDGDARRHPDPQRIPLRQLGNHPHRETLGKLDPVLRLGDCRQVARRRCLSLIHAGADRLDHAGEDPPGIRVEAEAHALPRPEKLQAVLPIVRHDPPLLVLDAGQDRRARTHVRPLADARLHLSWTRVLAPADGYVTNVQLRWSLASASSALISATREW